MKIGVLVRDTFPRVAKSGILTEDDLIKLQDEKYCKNTFDLNYSFLRKVKHGQNLGEQRLVNHYPRYYAKPITINGASYFVTSEWYDRNKSYYIKWLAAKGLEVN